MKKQLNQFIKNAFANSFFIKYLWKKLPEGIYIFNYHRVGDKTECNYARDVFSCNSSAFESQLNEIKSNFNVVNIEQLVNIFNSGKLTKRYAVITFDDGYKDNYDIAFPILRKLKLSALFLIPTNFIDSDAIPWWDELSFILRKNIGNTMLTPVTAEEVLFTHHEIEEQIKIFTRQIKQMSDSNASTYIEQLRARSPKLILELQESHQNLFMSWENIKLMHQAGMDIGSHTRTHKILSKLTEVQQAEELLESKKVIEQKLQSTIKAVAYPVGSQNCYTSDTIKLAKKTGYHLAFNNTSNVNTLQSNPHDLNRICVIEDDTNKLKATTVFNAYIRKYL